MLDIFNQFIQFEKLSEIFTNIYCIQFELIWFLQFKQKPSSASLNGVEIMYLTTIMILDSSICRFYIYPLILRSKTPDRSLKKNLKPPNSDGSIRKYTALLIKKAKRKKGPGRTALIFFFYGGVTEVNNLVTLFSLKMYIFEKFYRSLSQVRN